MNISTSLIEYVERNAAILERHSLKLAKLYKNCFMHTFDAFSLDSDGQFSDYLVTGDIPAMWLRDSSTQVWNYVRFAKESQIGELNRGVMKRQLMYIAIDPYANAFNEAPNDLGHTKDVPRKGPWVWERKYEIDSLAYPIRLLYKYFQITGDRGFVEEVLPDVMEIILNVWETEQYHFEKSTYRFLRQCNRYNDTLHHDGMGEPVGYTGMTWQGFRPSDDAVTYGYNIPGNLFAYVVLGYACEMLHDHALVKRAEKLRRQIYEGVTRYGIVRHEKYGEIFAYETDGLGNYELMDDANTPNLLSLPYIGFEDFAEVYKNTRRFVLSQCNPYYYEGKFAKGLGSPHEHSGYIWHMGLSMQGLTADDPEEMRELLDILTAADADTGYMHECFDPDDPRRFKRQFFTWSDSIFCEFAEKCIEKKIL